jgi:hypothetical protein
LKSEICNMKLLLHAMRHTPGAINEATTNSYVRNYKQNMQNKANFQKSQVSLSDLLIREYEQMDTWLSRKKQSQTKPIQTQFKAKTNPIRTQNKPNSKPIYRGVASGEAGFRTANLLRERTKSRFLNFHNKNNLTLCWYSLKYWAFDSR